MESNQLYLYTIKLNNEGAYYLRNGDFAAANTHFAASLNASKQLQMTTQLAQDDHERSCPKFDCTLDCLMMGQRERDDSKALFGNEQEYFVYEHPILIPLSEEDEHHAPEFRYQTNLVTISAAIIFNLSLCHHLSALSKRRNESKSLLRKAIQLYGFGLQLLDENDSCSIFRIATINNLGQIYQALDDMDKSDQCFRQLLMILVERSRRSTSAGIYEDFFRNVSYLLFPLSTTNAAAA